MTVRRGRKSYASRRLAAGYGLGGALAIFGYFGLVEAGAARPVQVITYCAISASAVGALIVGVRRHRPAHRGPWVLLILAQTVYLAADATFYVAHLVFHTDAFPAAADALYLAHYPLLAAGLLWLIRRRTPMWDWASGLDAAILAVGAGLLSWVFLIAPFAAAPGLTPLTRLVSTAYPVMDLLVLVVAARLILGAGPRIAAFYLLSTALVLVLLTDSLYGYQQLSGTYQAGNYLDALWLGSYLALGAAALHPTMVRVDERSAVATPDATASRLAVLAASSLAAPVLLVIQAARNDSTQDYVIAASSALLYLLVLARMSGLVNAQRLAAITDGLTGLRTRRYFEQLIAAEIERNHRHETQLGLILIDIDHFKQINDTYGHPGGDRVLCATADLMRQLCRRGDTVARYGGEEFAIVMAHTSDTELAAAAHRLQTAFATRQLPVTDTTTVAVTISVGAALMPHHTATATDLVSNADRALYEAKHQGRNRVIMYTPASGQPTNA